MIKDKDSTKLLNNLKKVTGISDVSNYLKLETEEQHKLIFEALENITKETSRIHFEWFVGWWEDNKSSLYTNKITKGEEAQIATWRFLHDVSKIAIPLYHKRRLNSKLLFIDKKAYKSSTSDSFLLLHDNRNRTKSNFIFTDEDYYVIDFCSKTEYKYLAYSILYGMIYTRAVKCIGINPALQDHFADLTMSLQYSDNKKPINDYVDDCLDELYKIWNHLEIGKKLHLTDESIGVYDALNGFFYDSYDYKQIRMAEELTLFIYKKYDIAPSRKDYLESVYIKTKELKKKYDIIQDFDNLTYGYVVDEIAECRWNRDFNKEEEDEDY